MSKETNTAAYERGYATGYLDGRTRKEKFMRYKVTIKRSTSNIVITCDNWDRVQKIITTVFSDVDNDASISVEMIAEEEK